MTYRRIVSFGLIAGMRIEEIHKRKPGEVMDLYRYRLEYERENNGLKRM